MTKVDCGGDGAVLLTADICAMGAPHKKATDFCASQLPEVTLSMMIVGRESEW